MKIEIQKNIPIPPSIKKEGVFPLDEMEVGDSFTVPQKTSSSARRYIRMHVKDNPEKEFTTRLIGDATRVWRIK